MNEVWYLLYEGTSVDGMGRGSYCGRTTDYYVAKAHHDKHHDNPYSTSGVKAFTDSAEFWIWSCSNWEPWARQNKLAPSSEP